MILRPAILFILTVGALPLSPLFGALPSTGVNVKSPLYDSVDLLEALGCGYATYRLFRPQTYADLRSAVDVQEGDPQEGQVCGIPRWLRKEKELLRLRPSQMPYVRFQTLVLGDETITLRGLEATISPTYSLWDRRPVGSGVMSYLDFSVQAESGSENFGIAFGITPSVGFSILDSLGTKFRFYIYEAFAKANYGWAELELAKQSLSFGNAAHGNLLLSGATAPMSYVRFGLRPHLMGFLGPATFQTFLTTETGASTTDGAHLLGFHFGLRPTTWLELGVLELYQFGGPLAPGLQAVDLLKMLVYLTDDEMNQRRQKMLSTHIGIRPWQRLHLYSQVAFDSLDEINLLLGLHLAKIGGFGFRAEYVSTAIGAYQASHWRSGLVYDGTPVGHPLGPDADGIYLDLYFPDLAEWRPAIGAFREIRGSSLNTAALIFEQRQGISLGVKKRWIKTEIELDGRFVNIEGTKNKPGADSSVGAGRFILRYSFL